MTDRIRLGKYLKSSLVAGDFIILNIAYFCTLWITHFDYLFASKWVWLIVNISLVPSLLLYSDIHNHRIVFADRVMLYAFKAIVVQVMVMIFLLYVFDIFDISIKTTILFITLLFLFLSAWWLGSRLCLKRLRRMGFNFKRVIIIGGGMTGEMVLKELQSDSGYGFRMMGLFDDDEKRRSIFSGSYTAGLDEVADFVHLNNIDIIYYTLDAEDRTAISRIIRIADEAGAEFVYVPKFNKVLSGQFQVTSVGDMPSMTHTLSPLHRMSNKICKRVLDLCISIPFLIVSPILFIPIAIGIKLTSPGPIFFKQKRTGIYGREFMCYKFRTMHVNSQADTLQASESDPRKTKFGDFLRRSSLDELPQFFNVLIGNMSVVGPRPHMVSHTEEYSVLIDKYMVRHAVKPGITGWAQVNGFRGGTKHLWQMEKRVEYDVWYIRNWNFFLDIKIIFLTVFNGLRGEENAY
jgi:putative colanic acid biosynthesis UDP-glucose lipid carrier transferase